ncbi:hypothetical protein [Rhizobium sp. 18055]|uniref:hypothetical protein n=1 Tax=Rhizobium sp. 18055 TaxID=2681403 RepID=UPI00135709FB|nr:hypothetical protein [Rhizobium sp. 18055]
MAFASLSCRGAVFHTPRRAQARPGDEPADRCVADTTLGAPTRFDVDPISVTLSHRL